MTRTLTSKRHVRLCHFDMFTRVACYTRSRVILTRLLMSQRHVCLCHFDMIPHVASETLTRVIYTRFLVSVITALLVSV